MKNIKTIFVSGLGLLCGITACLSGSDIFIVTLLAMIFFQLLLQD